MPKPKNRPAAVNTPYFEGVTPLWVAPDREPIPKRFHAACMSLADRAGPYWPENDKTGYFPLRHSLVKICEQWHAHDWDADEYQIAARKLDEKNRKNLADRTKAFRLSLGKSAFRYAERDLGLSIVSALCPEAQIDLTLEQGCDAVASALQQFETAISRPDRFPVRYGPLEYDTFPNRKPAREIAIALVLADLATGFRMDEHREGGTTFPRAPLLSPNLPWKAIAEFATAFTDDRNASIDPNNIATRVGNLREKVVRIFRHP